MKLQWRSAFFLACIAFCLGAGSARADEVPFSVALDDL